MSWQDTLIGFATILLSYALIPQVYHGFRYKKKTVVIQTSLITTLGLSMLSISYFSLQMWFSLITNMTAVFLWALLLVQGIIYR